MSADARTVLLVFLARFANSGESIGCTENTTTEPDSVSLYHVLCNLDIDLIVSASDFIGLSHTIVHALLKLRLESIIETLKQCATT